MNTSNYLAALCVAALATAACADDHSQAAKPAVKSAQKSTIAPAAPATAQAAAAKPATTPAAKPAAAPAAAATPTAGAKSFVQKPGTGTLKFTFQQAGADNPGTFGKFDTLLKYDESNLTGSSLRVTIQMASLDTQNAERDETIAGADLFDTQKFPTATYVASSLAKTATGVEAIGKLTLRGASKDLRLPLVLKRTADGYELSGAVTIKRLDYGVGQGEWQATDTVGNEVKISYQVPLIPAGAATR